MNISECYLALNENVEICWLQRCRIIYLQMKATDMPRAIHLRQRGHERLKILLCMIVMISGLVERPDRLPGEPERANSSPDSGRPVSADPTVPVHAAGGIRELTARRMALKRAILITLTAHIPRHGIRAVSEKCL